PKSSASANSATLATAYAPTVCAPFPPSSFQGKLGLPIHRWYRLTPSFSPQLAHDIADHFGLTAKDYVLDPFSGVGTVPLCMKYRGISACSVELNPYLRFVGHVKTRTYGDLDWLRVAFDDFVERFSQECHIPRNDEEAKRLVEENLAFIPRINYPERWWSAGNLGQVAFLRRMVSRLKADYAITATIRRASGRGEPGPNYLECLFSFLVAITQAPPCQLVFALGTIRIGLENRVKGMLNFRKTPADQRWALLALRVSVGP
ncbi:MAG TPA: hypothetical protein VMV69_28840, partial [Pirellulales bacterium]|nr:hypothetical protein [Pirellulales bacterium]